MTLDVSEDAAEALEPRAALTVYRFVQEALTNAFRHSGASRVAVSLAYDSGASGHGMRDPTLAGLRLSVSDNGHGLPARTGDGTGLAGMRERIKALGGAFAIRSDTSQGTVVEATFAGGDDAGQDIFPQKSGGVANKVSNV